MIFCYLAPGFNSYLYTPIFMDINFTQVFPLLRAPSAQFMRNPESLSNICYLASLLAQAKKEAAANAENLQPHLNTDGKVLVMLADDDHDDRDLLEEAISDISKNIRVQPVADGLELMKILNEPAQPLPSLIFLDLNMPGKGGKQCLKEIRNNARLNAVPVVIYSTSANKKDIQETHGIGANRYISKPNTFKGLVAVLEKVFLLDVEQLKTVPAIQHFVLSANTQ